MFTQIKHIHALLTFQRHGDNVTWISWPQTGLIPRGLQNILTWFDYRFTSHCKMLNLFGKWWLKLFSCRKMIVGADFLSVPDYRDAAASTPDPVYRSAFRFYELRYLQYTSMHFICQGCQVVTCKWVYLLKYCTVQIQRYMFLLFTPIHFSALIDFQITTIHTYSLCPLKTEYSISILVTAFWWTINWGMKSSLMGRERISCSLS